MSVIKPPWYKTTVRRLTLYQQNSLRVIMLKSELEGMGIKITSENSLAPAFTGASDSVGNLAGRVLDKQTELRQIELEVRQIEKAVSLLSGQKQLIITVKYLQENKDTYVMRVLRKEHHIKSRDTYYRLKDKAVEELANMLGEKKGE